jgi:hypothetical protein
MAGQYNLNINQLKTFAPDSAILAFRPEDSGSPQQDWCRHLQAFPHYRRELEEFAIMGETVLRIADGIEAAPIDKVKILSLEYAVKTLQDETDAKEFVRSVKAIASPDAGQYELEQIAAFYYGEIRRRTAPEVLTEMGLLGMQMEAVVATIDEREIYASETEIEPQKLTVADQRRIRAAQEKSFPMPAPTPNFDDEMAAVKRRVGQSKATKIARDEFEEFYLGDEGKSCEELDADFLAHEKLEQYDENGIVGFSMSGGQHAVVVYEFDSEVDSSYLPFQARELAKEMSLIFVGHEIGGAAAQKARHFTLAQRILQSELRQMEKGVPALFSTPMPEAQKFSALPFSEEDFSEWLAAKLDYLYPRRALRSVRRLTTDRAGRSFEYQAAQEINPDFDEMQYVASVCQTLWNQMRGDFHLRSLRRETYQNLHLKIRKTEDTAEVAKLKKEAYDEFKERKNLTLKEFTALNTAAKSQEARLINKVSAPARKTLDEIGIASAGRLRYLKYFLYNDHAIQALTRQEKQRLWDAIRARETALQTAIDKPAAQPAKAIQPPHFQRGQQAQKQVVRVTPRSV